MHCTLLPNGIAPKSKTCMSHMDWAASDLSFKLSKFQNLQLSSPRNAYVGHAMLGMSSLTLWARKVDNGNYSFPIDYFFWWIKECKKGEYYRKYMQIESKYFEKLFFEYLRLLHRSIRWMCTIYTHTIFKVCLWGLYHS